MDVNDKEIKVRFALGETFDIDGVEIFMAGKWNGDAYTVEDLDAMVQAFHEIGDKMKPYLKLGHGDDQNLLRSDELPAAGWIKNIYRKGDRLLADFTKVPKKIYELMRSGAYRRVSSEIFVNIPIAGKVYKWVLKAVSLLGGETPAVHDLNDIIALYALGDTVRVYEANNAETKTYQMSAAELIREDHSMDLEAKLKETEVKLSEACKQLSDVQDALKARDAVLAEKDAQVQKLAEERDAHMAELKKLAEEKRAADVKATLDKWVSEKKINPSQVPMLEHFMLNAQLTGEKKFKLGDKEVDSLTGIVEAFVDAGKVKLSTDEESELGDTRGLEEQDQLDRAAKEYQEKHKVSYKEALIAVSVRN